MFQILGVLWTECLNLNAGTVTQRILNCKHGFTVPSSLSRSFSMVTTTHETATTAVDMADIIQDTTIKPRLPTLLPSSDADLITNILIEQHNPYHAMESPLHLHGISLSTNLIHQTLLRLRHSSKLALSFFSWATSHPHFPSIADTASFDLMIDILGRVRQFDVAWQLFGRLQSLNLTPTSTTFLVMTRRLISAGFTRQAIRAFDDMPCFVESGQTREDFIYLLDTLCKYGYVKVAMEVFNKRKSGYELCPKIYTVLIAGWCKVKKVDMGEKLLNEMVEKGLDPNVVTYNVLLHGICRRSSLHPDERFEKIIRNANKLFDEMTQRGIEPDVTSYSIVLHVYSRAHRPQLAIDKLEEMKSRGICPSVASYTSVVKCLCSCGRIEEAEKLLDEMVENGVTPSPATYSCFFKEYKGRKDSESAMKLYRRMRDEQECGCMSLHTCNVLLGMLSSLNKMGAVKEVWNDMEAKGLGPDLDSYTLLIHGLIEKKRWKEACELFVQMIEKGFLPQKITFETLYRSLIQADKLRTWRRLQKRLEQESISFGSEFACYHLKPYKR